MLKCRSVLLILAAVACAPFAWAAERDGMPDAVSGTFVQRKTLSDLDVTLVSTGTFRFEKGRLFVWRTQTPVETVFSATPSNYAYTANGKTKTQPLAFDVSSFDKVFQIKEVASLVKEVRLTPETGFPDRASVRFANGDRLEIDLKADGR